MPRPASELPPIDSNEPLESVLQRCPSKAFVTPASNKPITIRPLKRTKTSADDDAAPVPDPPLLDLDADVDPEKPRGLLSPRKLDMDQAVVLADPSLVPSDDELEEEEPIQATQPYPDPAEDIEEGELSSVPALLMRCESASLPGA